MILNRTYCMEICTINDGFIQYDTEKFFFHIPQFSIVPKLKCLLRTPDLKRQFTWFLPIIESWAQTLLLYFSYDAFILRRNIYHSYIMKEKWVPIVPGSFSDSFLVKEGWKWPRCVRTRLFLPLWGIIFCFKAE